MNCSISLPKTDSVRCRAKKQISLRLPAGTKMGDCPSGPPPVGSLVSTSETRPRRGKTGYNRRAVGCVR